MENKVKEKILQGEPVLGTFINLGGTSIVECMSISGLDFLIIDTEHGPFSVENSLNFILAAESKGITPFVRVKDISRSSILNMLDIGAKGIIAPNIETVEEVKKLVEYGKFNPVGKRGFGAGRIYGYGYSDLDIIRHFNTSNEQTLIIPQCETKGALENIEEIVAIEGVDGIFIGPYDLSIALGIPGQFAHPDFTNAIKRILEACKNAGKFSFIYSGDSSTTVNYLNYGFDGIAIGTDASVLINAFKTIVNEVREISNVVSK